MVAIDTLDDGMLAIDISTQWNGHVGIGNSLAKLVFSLTTNKVASNAIYPDQKPFKRRVHQYAVFYQQFSSKALPLIVAYWDHRPNAGRGQQ
jgi:hypothetical protein